VARGVDLQGICLFPAVDMPDWHNGAWLHNGIADVERRPDGTLRRVPFTPYVEALRGWQRKLNLATTLDADPYDAVVDLGDVKRVASESAPAPDADWH
jgi:hypothetical protein